MLSNFFKTALRHFAQNKLYASINIVGLAIGVSCMLLAILYWKDEHSFDQFHAKNPNIFRVTTTMTNRDNGERNTTGETRQVQGPAFKAAVPEVKDMVRLLGGDIMGDVRHDDEVLNLRMLFADDDFFDVFSFPLLHGDAAALKEINSVVLSEETALRFFHSTDVVGKLLHLDADPSAERLGYKPMVVTGVTKKLPANSSIQFDVLLPLKFMQLSFEDPNWLGSYLGTFVVLAENADLQAVVQQFNAIHQ